MQGFVSVAEVDSKGRARRLPVKAGIRRALCFPGGSTLMVSHLNNDILAHSANTSKLCHSLKTPAATKSQDVEEICIANAFMKMTSGIEIALHEVLVKYDNLTDLKKLDGG